MCKAAATTTRQALCEKLSALVNLKSNRIQDRQLADLTSVQEKQIFITSLIREVGIHDIFLPRDVKGKLKFDFTRMLDNLNTILLSQYLQRSNNCLEKGDIVQIQSCDPVLSNIANKVQTTGQVNDKFVIRDQILFILSLVYGMQIYRLCLPLNLAREVLTVIHQYNGAHMSIDNLRLKFKSNFWCHGIENALQSIKKFLFVL